VKLGDMKCPWHPTMTLRECQDLHKETEVVAISEGGDVGSAGEAAEGSEAAEVDLASPEIRTAAGGIGGGALHSSDQGTMTTDIDNAPEDSLYEKLDHPLVALVAWEDGRLALETVLTAPQTVQVLEHMIEVLKADKPDKVVEKSRSTGEIKILSPEEYLRMKTTPK
jgi:hypothetical protein